MSTEICRGIVVNAPDVFADPAFQKWLNNGAPKFSWHRAGPVSEWSDVVVLVDPSLNGEGSDSDMPADIWDRIIAECRTTLGAASSPSPPYMVRLTNLSV
ncbi:hypothetical protein GCM10019059_38000 [Camelimonas fluminis]|uniref:Uncharacterized protein n=1 Tax=Camelimonas fluminis TaxID=1576911 RepID=A0ABV7UBI5_9HYPH|nr:hypothetical protein [Camelimonas fluminis]GHE74919.1 hypothetical protein GCM10019059_38000 [Camelimonas fluminis]